MVLRFIPNKSEELSSKQRGGLRAGWMFMLGVEEIKGKRIYLLFVSDFFVIFTKTICDDETKKKKYYMQLRKS